MKKILFLRPQAPGARFTPFGILYLAAYIKKNEYPSEINIIDLRGRSFTKQQISSEIEKFKPDLIGISSLSTESTPTHELVGICKQVLPNVPVVIGGPYASAEWQYVLEDAKVDYCIVGEGEKNFLEFLKTMGDGHDPGGMPGVASRDGSGKSFLNDSLSFIANLDDIPFPAYELINIEEYSCRANSHLPAFDINKRFTQMFTSRGCPYRCTFCHNIFGKKIRYRSLGNTLDEIDWLINTYGIEEIHFEDDSFNMDLKHAKNVCMEIIKRKYNLRFAFPNGIRADHVDEELVDLFSRMGVYSVAYGIESASKAIRTRIKKALDLDKLNKAISLTARRGIVVSGFLMVGFPNETDEEIEETILFACRSELHIATVSRVIPFPGTELYDEVLQLGFHYNRELFNKITFEKVTINFSELSNEQLEAKIRSAMRRFYLNPLRLLRIFIVYPGKVRLFSEGFRVIKKKLFGLYSGSTKHDCKGT